MKTKASSNPPPLQLYTKEGETRERALARQMLRPTMGAAKTVLEFNRIAGALPITELVAELTDQVRACANGDMSRSEAWLIAQTHSLDALFHSLARCAAANMGEYYVAAEGCMRLALKGQAQCLATIQALSSLKTPRPIAYVQQNIGNAVQVNNAPQPSEANSRPRGSENQPNELLEQQCNEWVDAGQASPAVGVDPAMATLGKIDGASDN
jgi:hypothetical protein